MSPSVYYNEIDSYCAQWLRNLMDADLIPRGDIDTRSIEDVIPSEVAGYDQCHFFAGLGGWPYALQLAGWGTRPVWTGSCPCQPFSAAGKGAGFADERHLWPAWQHLISQCNPPTIFGEQVANAAEWLGLVCGDLENMGYAVGFNHIEAASAGVFHGRDRAYFVADANCHAFGSKSYFRAPSGREVPHGNNSGRCMPDALFAYEFVVGSDGSSRPCEPGTFPMAYALPEAMGKLRAYGNAIVPDVARAFITAYMQARGLIAEQQAAA